MSRLMRETNNLYLRVRVPMEASRALKSYVWEFIQPKATCRALCRVAKERPGGTCEDAVGFRSPHGEEGDFDGDAPCFEGEVFAFGRLAGLPVVFSIVKVAAKVCDV